MSDESETISDDLRKYIRILTIVREMTRNVSRSRWGDFLKELSEDYYAELSDIEKVYARGFKDVVTEPHE